MTSTRTRLARRIASLLWEADGQFTGSEQEFFEQHNLLCMGEAEAILDELMEPGEGAIEAAVKTPEMKAVDALIVFAAIHGQKLETEAVPLVAAWQAMLRHIKEQP